MPSHWLAVTAGTDLRARARQLETSWEKLVAGRALNAELPPQATAELRPAIVDSWRRSLATGLDPTDLLPSIEADPSEMRERWLEHPLGSLRHVLAAHLQMLARESNSLVQVTDPSGLTLHLDGPEWLKARAAEMNLVEGARCAETVNGTNGVGTALAADHPVQVFAFEHFSHHHREWVCSGSPVHDPISGRLVGVLDLSSPWRIAHPRSLELVTAAANALEQCLLETRRDQDARLRRRYGDFATKSTDLLVNAEGYVLIGDSAHQMRFVLPEDGGVVSMSDGSLAVAEPLGNGEAYLLRKLALPRAMTTRADRIERPKGLPPGKGAALVGGGEGLRATTDGGPTAQAERHLHDLADEQAALRRVATLVARESSPQQLFAVVAEQVARIVNVPLVRVLRYRADGEAVEFVGGWGESIDPIAVGRRWLLDGPSVLAAVWRSGLPARLDDYTGVGGEAASLVRQAQMRSAVASPITVEGRLWGAIAVLSPREEPLPESTEARLADFTELVATAIANADSRDAIARLADEQAALRRVATLVAHRVRPSDIFSAVSDEVQRLFGLDEEASGVATVVRFDPGPEYALVGAAKSIDGLPLGTRWGPNDLFASTRVHRTGRFARVDESELSAGGHDAATLRRQGLLWQVASPIVVEGRLWGAITLNAGAELPSDTEERLERFTDLVATAIANTESRTELAASERHARKLAEEQAALRRVATLVAHESSPEEIFSRVAEEVGQVLGVPIVVLVRYEADGSVMRVLGGWSERAFPVPMGTRLSLDGPSHFADVWATGRPARLDDVVDLPGEIASAMRQADVGSGAASPILVGGRIWGAIAVGLFGLSERLPDDIEVRLADFTELVATAIGNSEARDYLRRVVDEQAALRRVATLIAEGAAPAVLFSAVTEEVAGLFEAAAVTLDRYDGDVSTVLAATNIGFPVGSRWPLDVDSLAARVYAAGQPVHVADYADIAGAIPREMWEGHLSKSEFGVPIVVDGNLWGVLCVGTPELDRNPSETAERIGRFTELVATAVSNATMRAEVAASRARVIAAGDETRRRIERDLHDGAQQQLVTLALELRAAEGRIPTGLGDMRAEVGRFADRLTGVIEELREMSRGIHPAILTEGGLSPAVEALALRSPVPVRLSVRSEQRLPEGIEVAAYYVVSEALTNAAKHADASRVRVDLDIEEEMLHLSIVDDGVGGAKLGGGSGLIGLKDRVEALGGAIDVVSPPGSGTRIDVKVPLLGDAPVASGSELLSRA